MAKGRRAMSVPDGPGKTAVITGGAGGLGLALDAGLRARGWSTVLIDLPGPQLQALAPLPNRRTYGCDLTDRVQLRRLCQEISSTQASIDLVIYNAGITWIGASADLSDAAHRKVFDINYFAATDMAQALQADLRRAGGTHLAISSVAGFCPLYHRTAYAASKHALEGFFKSLRCEEKPFGVRVVIAAPSFIATNLGRPEGADAQTQAAVAGHSGIARPGSAADGMDYMSPESAAQHILTGLDRRRDFLPVGRVARLSALLNRFFPRIFAAVMTGRIAR